jgi:S-adenosyl-L-methionine hydrolase (adenosine-forming)
VPRPIVFLSDYGLDDEFVGVCHSIIARIAPEVPVIDLSHGIPPRDIVRGALVLADAIPYSPGNAVFLAVVDPGVGSARLPVVVEAGEAYLIGPDNGLLSLALDQLGGPTRAFAIESEHVTLSPMSRTFHGRDVFAPAAAHVAGGGSPESLGRTLDPAKMSRIPSPKASVKPQSVECRVIGIDRFGNVQLSASDEDLRYAGLGSVATLAVRTPKETLSFPRAGTFADVPEGDTALIVDATGRFALIVNGGSAAGSLNVRVGDPVEVFEPEAER